MKSNQHFNIDWDYRNSTETDNTNTYKYNMHFPESPI